MSEDFGAALRRRFAVGLTQHALAKRTNLDFIYIDTVENGRLPPPAANAINTTDDAQRR